MKKILLSIAAVFLTMGAMAQTTVNLTFVRNGENASVNVEGMDGVTATIEATSPSPQGNATKTGVWNTGGNMGTDTNILCTSTNTSAATTPITYTLTLKGIDASMALSNIVFKHITANASGNYQPHTNGDIRHCNIALNVNGSNIETKNDFDIWVQGASGSAGKDVAFENINDIKANDGILTITLSISKGTNNNGCFYGLKNVAITFIQEEVVEPEPTFANSYTLTQVTASDLMAKTEPTYIVMKNLSRRNPDWYAGTSSSVELTDVNIFVWEPTDGGFRLKNLEGEYIQNGTEGTNISFGTVDNAAVFTATRPYVGGTGTAAMDHDNDSNPYITSDQDENLVRFVNGNGVWINVQNTDGTPGTPKYNKGKGGWTIQYVYEATMVEAYDVEITDAKYATFYAVSEVAAPEEVNVYYATSEGIESGKITLTEIGNRIIPANTAVIIYSETAGNYEFAASGTKADAISNNLLKGTPVSINITEEAYVLGNVNGIGLYKAKTTDVSTSGGTKKVFLNNAGKAYLPASAVPAAAQGAANFSFRFGEGTTGIEEVKTENGNVKAIYDLTGRRVEAITAPGIYVVNGRKVLVK